ncbi:hypothetical protein T492DRAFT_1147827 [Pavlovales sp. CCMP2436]|nr:hypothetical protein T492DRAFT_1147827 [Pavlovales sp. CCMP2436]
MTLPNVFLALVDLLAALRLRRDPDLVGEARLSVEAQRRQCDGEQHRRHVRAPSPSRTGGTEARNSRATRSAASEMAARMIRRLAGPEPRSTIETRTGFCPPWRAPGRPQLRREAGPRRRSDIYGLPHLLIASSARDVLADTTPRLLTALAEHCASRLRPRGAGVRSSSRAPSKRSQSAPDRPPPMIIEIWRQVFCGLNTAKKRPEWAGPMAHVSPDRIVHGIYFQEPITASPHHQKSPTDYFSRNPSPHHRITKSRPRNTSRVLGSSGSDLEVLVLVRSGAQWVSVGLGASWGVSVSCVSIADTWGTGDTVDAGGEARVADTVGIVVAFRLRTHWMPGRARAAGREGGMCGHGWGSVGGEGNTDGHEGNTEGHGRARAAGHKGNTEGHGQHGRRDMRGTRKGMGGHGRTRACTGGHRGRSDFRKTGRQSTREKPGGKAREKIGRQSTR